MSYDNTNSGVLFRNEKKQAGDKLPDYRGTLNVDGVAWEIAGWLKESSKQPGKKFMSLRIQPPYKKQDVVSTTPVKAPPPTDSDEDNVPF